MVVVVPFVDARSTRDRCGMQKGNTGFERGDMRCTEAAGVWITKQVALALRDAGFEVLTRQRDARRSAVVIEGELLTLFVEPVFGIWTGSHEADIALRLKVHSETGLRAERTFYVKGWRGGRPNNTLVDSIYAHIAPGDGPHEIALERASAALLHEVVQAVLELMDIYPELG